MAARARARLTPAEGRRFAFTLTPAFLVVAGVLAWRGHARAAVVAGLVGGVLGAAGAIVPGRLGWVHRAWMGFALAISKVTTPVGMAIIYFAVMLPVGLVRRRLGGNPLVRRAAPGGTYWVERPRGARRSDLRRQF